MLPRVDHLVHAAGWDVNDSQAIAIMAMILYASPTTGRTPEACQATAKQFMQYANANMGMSEGDG